MTHEDRNELKKREKIRSGYFPDRQENEKLLALFIKELERELEFLGLDLVSHSDLDDKNISVITIEQNYDGYDYYMTFSCRIGSTPILMYSVEEKSMYFPDSFMVIDALKESWNRVFRKMRQKNREKRRKK